MRFLLLLFPYLFPHETPTLRYTQPLEVTEFASGLSGIDCIYVVNLEERPERWNRMKTLCEERRLKVNRVNAINGWKFPRDIEIKLMGPYLNRANYLGGGRIGCLLSHLSIFKDALDRGFQVIWILEDDADFLEDIQQLPQLLVKLSKIDPLWDAFYTDQDYRNADGTYIKACAIDPRPNQPLYPLSHYTQKNKVSENIVQIYERYGTHSIFWSQRGLQKALEYFKHVYLWTSFDIDIHYIPDIREYAPTKDIVSNLTHSSSDTIQESPLNPESSSLSK
ncbi:MAG: glycosyltransferase family 25 protein [Verrucomicrobiota bacterium]|nr:glycosyltransferase family 25 protein [Verrucomicrobiota bacterium]